MIQHYKSRGHRALWPRKQQGSNIEYDTIIWAAMLENIRAVLWESWLGAFRINKDAEFFHADNERWTV